jgi:hypothetical protein
MRISTISAGIALAIGLSAVSAAEPIAEVAAVDGLVLKSDGTRFVEISEGTVLRAQDRIISTEGSRAVLAFNSGCRYEMSELELLTLTDESTCQSAAASAERQSDLLTAADRTLADSDRMRAIEQAATSDLSGPKSLTEDLRWLPPFLAAAVGITAAFDDRSSNRSSFLSP